MPLTSGEAANIMGRGVLRPNASRRSIGGSGPQAMPMVAGMLCTKLSNFWSASSILMSMLLKPFVSMTMDESTDSKTCLVSAMSPLVVKLILSLWALPFLGHESHW